MAFQPCNESEKKYALQSFPDSFEREVRSKAESIVQDWKKSKTTNLDSIVADKAKEILQKYPNFSKEDAYIAAYQDLWTEELLQKAITYARRLRDEDPRYEYVQDRLGDDSFSFRGASNTAESKITSFLRNAAIEKLNASLPDRAQAAFRSLFSSTQTR